MIQEIFAEADYGVRVYEKTEESYDSYIINCFLKIYGIPDDLTDDEEENIFGGEIGKAVQIGTVTGLLILGGQAEKNDMDIYDICDCTDSYAEFIYSALSEGNGPLAFDPYLDIFCIDTIEMCDGFDNDETKIRILNSLPMFLLKAYHIFPDIIADRPKSLPYEKSIHQKVKEGMAREIINDYMNSILDEPTQKHTEGVKLMLDEDQQNYLLGRRIKGEGYPESAKDTDVIVKYDFDEKLKYRLDMICRYEKIWHDLIPDYGFSCDTLSFSHIDLPDGFDISDVIKYYAVRNFDNGSIYGFCEFDNVMSIIYSYSNSHLTAFTMVEDDNYLLKNKIDHLWQLGVAEVPAIKLSVNNGRIIYADTKEELTGGELAFAKAYINQYRRLYGMKEIDFNGEEE